MTKRQIEFNYINSIKSNESWYENTNISLRDKLIDPDAYSIALYDDLLSYFFTERNKEINRIRCAKRIGYTIHVINDARETIIFSSDYIGPSAAWAYKIGKQNDDEVKEIFKDSRTLGGHMLWQVRVNYPTINVGRSGTAGVYDRIDWTLLLLKVYYKSVDRQNKRIEEINFINLLKDELALFGYKGEFNSYDMNKIERLFKSFRNSDLSLSLFNSFKNFCDFFMLRDNFVNHDYKINELTPFIPIKPSMDEYRTYTKKNICCIKKRNDILISTVKN